MNTFELQYQNDIQGLSLINDFVWLRNNELGMLLWPESRSPRQQADRLIRSWRKRRLVIERVLPYRMGRAILLGSGGVRLLTEVGVTAKSGKDIGQLNEGIWTPPHTWRHDLLATIVLAETRSRGFEVMPEAAIRKANEHLKKIPDGLIFENQSCYWLEVESARKTGAAMAELARAVITAANGMARTIAGRQPNKAMIAYLTQSRDENNHRIDHRARITQAISDRLDRPITVTWAMCDTLQPTKAQIEFKKETIKPNLPKLIRRQMETNGFEHSKNPNGTDQYDSWCGQHENDPQPYPVSIYEFRGFDRNDDPLHCWVAHVNGYEEEADSLDKAKDLASEILARVINTGRFEKYEDE